LFYGFASSKDKQGITTAKVLCDLLMGTLATISGVLLIKGVARIRRFFKEKEAEDFLNTELLWQHAAAFGLYLFSTAAKTIVLGIFELTVKS
jgi:hypothetical protein